MVDTNELNNTTTEAVLASEVVNNVDSSNPNDTLVSTQEPQNTEGGFKPRFDNSRSPRPGFRNGDRKGGFDKNSKFSSKRREFKKDEAKDPFTTSVITVKRVTRVVKGGKRMRFAALVVVGDKAGQVGFANKKGTDYQDAVAKATKKAKENLVKISMNENYSVKFTTITKFKAAKVLIKPAKDGTSLIAGGYIRPVLELAGIKNIYAKILGSNNKVVGVEAVFNALKNYI